MADTFGADRSVGLENLALNRPAAQSSLSRWSRPNDAQGAVNGRRTGGFGFHTDHEEQPWWRVDLEAVVPVVQVVLWNREDGCAERARHLAIELSRDGDVWECAAHTGDTAFGGARTHAPLIVPCGGREARYVRIRKTEPGYLHLDEVEVHGPEHPSRRAFRDFCMAIGEDPSIFARRHKDGAGLRFVAPGAPPTVQSLTLLRGGRFGNSVTQLLNAAHFARLHGIGRIHIAEVNPGGLTEHQLIGGIEFRLDAADGSLGADLQARMYYRSQFPRSYASLDAARMAAIGAEILAPLVAARFAPRPAPAVPTLHLHLRAGDVFSPRGVPETYVQPPLAFYTLVVRHAQREHGIRRVVMVYEDEGNPCVAALRDWLARQGIAHAEQSATLEEDVAELLSATHLAVSRGTFAFPVYLLSPRLRSVYGFRDDAEIGMERVSYGELLRHRGVRLFRAADAAGGYIGEAAWRNTEEQRAMMLDYPEASLVLEER